MVFLRKSIALFAIICYTIYMKCFIIAMDKEAQPIIDQMKKPKTKLIYNKKVVLGKLFGKKTAIVICGVGKCNAAMATQYAINKFKPTCIINIGTAGGLNKRCNVGELYGVAGVVQYDFDLCQLNGTKMGTLNEFEENYLPLNTVARFPLRKLGTGDRFNDSKDDYRLLTKELDADLRDMECGAIVQTCIHAKVPVYAFKAVSDLAKSGSTTEQFLANMQLCMQTIGNNVQSLLSAIDG